jgi:hypothetical protein
MMGGNTLKINVDKKSYTCPVCAYSEMSHPPESWHICPCCGTEFDVDDYKKPHEQLRAEWIDSGFHWFSKATHPPKAWCPYRQLIDAGHGADLIIHPRFEKDADYRYEVNVAWANVRIARQLKVLRDRHDPPLTQTQLALISEMKQSRISELEKIDYFSWSVITFARLAKALGLGFSFRFESWGELRPAIAGDLSPEALYVPPFEQDPVFHKARQREEQDSVAPPSKVGTLLGRPSPETQSKSREETFRRFEDQLALAGIGGTR